MRGSQAVRWSRIERHPARERGDGDGDTLRVLKERKDQRKETRNKRRGGDEIRGSSCLYEQRPDYQFSIRKQGRERKEEVVLRAQRKQRLRERGSGYCERGFVRASFHLGPLLPQPNMDLGLLKQGQTSRPLCHHHHHHHGGFAYLLVRTRRSVGIAALLCIARIPAIAGSADADGSHKSWQR